MYDVTIIGAGVVGSAIARELSRYEGSFCLVEKAGDVASGASKANSGIVHGGYVGKAGTLKGELCIKGNAAFDQLEKELHFGFRRNGALTVAFDEEDVKQLHKIRENALAVGHPEEDAVILDRQGVVGLEPAVSDEVIAALYIPSAGVASPYEMTIALAENAVQNGVELKLLTEVVDIEKKDDHFLLKTGGEDIATRRVINAAGLFSGVVGEMAGDPFEILPRRGQYILLGKDQGHLAKTVIFQTPTKKGKGVLVTSTYHGNLMIGPDAEDTGDPEDIDTTEERLKWIVKEARRSIPTFSLKRTLTTFSGNRARPAGGDFIIQAGSEPGVIHCAGIESPGFTSSPAIALRVMDLLREGGMTLRVREDFDPIRPAIIKKKGPDFEGSTEATDPSAHIICRCEQVTEAEIREALSRPLPVRSLDAVKFRTRAGMGNCQGAFCGPRVRKLLSEILDLPEEKITKRGEGVGPPPKRVAAQTIKKWNL